MTTALDDKIVSFKGSSMFRSGDRDSFQTTIGEHKLPGKFCPDEYLSYLDLEEVEGRVAVVCPGNCGLMAELRKRGADRVVGFEPRTAFHRSMTTLLQLLNQEADTPIWPFSSNFWWPSSAVLKESYDLVVWANGLELSNTPAVHIEGALSILKPSGTLYIEVNHGSHGVPERRVNAWRPTEEAFTAVVHQTRPDARVEKVRDGRLDGRVIYRVTEDVIVVEEDSTVHSSMEMVEEIQEQCDKEALAHLDEMIAGDEGVVDEATLRQEALNQFPTEVQTRIANLLEAGFDYHGLKVVFEREGIEGIDVLAGTDPNA